MHKHITTSAQINRKRLEEFEVKVGVHQGSTLSPLLSAIAMDKTAKDVRETDVKNIFMIIIHSWMHD